MESLVKSIWLKLVVIGSLLWSCYSLAEDSQVDVGSWSIGVNLGLGQRSTFITGQEDVDIFVLPDFHYYSEQLFFDNGTLGYSFKETSSHVFSAITELNPYGLYFDQSAFGESFNPLFLVSETSTESVQGDSRLVTESPVDSATGGDAFEQSVDYPSYTLPQPDITLDMGVQHNWFIDENQNVTIKLVRDVTGEHSGLRGKFTWSIKQDLEPVRVKLNIGFDWLDSKSSNYYFSLTPDQSRLAHQNYQLGSSINPFLSVTASMPLTKKMSLVSHFKYLKLDSDIHHSPVTSKGYALTHFAGIHYKFW